VFKRQKRADEFELYWIGLVWCRHVAFTSFTKGGDWDYYTESAMTETGTNAVDT
jgi:hypothetical protein